MATNQHSRDLHQVLTYQIRLKGHLGCPDTGPAGQWAEWFEGMSLSLEKDGTTLLSGPVADQAALYGLLRKVRDLGMPLLSVICVDFGEGNEGLNFQ